MAEETITIPRLATAPKPRRKKPTKKKAAPKPEYVNVNAMQFGYNALLKDALRATTLYGQPIPEDLEERAKFFQDKYEYVERNNISLKAQVDLLKSIINSAMTRSCSGSC